jgi:Tfp pilus assembly protein PilV
VTAGKGLRAAGFTLIETMISMFFISFIVGELAMVSNYARRSTHQARRLTEANLIAEGVLEKARNSAYTNIDGPFTALDSPPDPIAFDLNKDGVVETFNETCTPTGPVVTCTCAAGSYTVTRTVSSLLPATTTLIDASTAVDVNVAVSWMDARGATQMIRVSTVRTKF